MQSKWRHSFQSDVIDFVAVRRKCEVCTRFTTNMTIKNDQMTRRIRFLREWCLIHNSTSSITAHNQVGSTNSAFWNSHMDHGMIWCRQFDLAKVKNNNSKQSVLAAFSLSLWWVFVSRCRSRINERDLFNYTVNIISQGKKWVWDCRTKEKRFLSENQFVPLKQ